MDRALKEALIDVNDLDRDEGVFYVNFSQEDEKGFFGRIFSARRLMENSKSLLRKLMKKPVGLQSTQRKKKLKIMNESFFHK